MRHLPQPLKMLLVDAYALPVPVHYHLAGVNVGRTTAGNIAVALDLANNVEGKNIVTLLYDRQDKYDTPMPD